MDENKLKDFLKGYVEILRKGIDLSEFKPGVFPLQMKTEMPAGGIKITTDNGDYIAFVSCDEGGGPSMPVGPAAMTFARLFVNLTNAYYEYNKEKA